MTIRKIISKIPISKDLTSPLGKREIASYVGNLAIMHFSIGVEQETTILLGQI